MTGKRWPRCFWLYARWPDRDGPVAKPVLGGRLKGERDPLSCLETAIAIHDDHGEVRPATSWGLCRVDYAESLVGTPLSNRSFRGHAASMTFRSVGVGTSSRTVRHRSWAGPIFQSCPRASGAVQRLGTGWLQSRRNGADPRPSAFQAGHIPSCYGSCERYALSPVAAVCRWSLLLLSPLLSTRRSPSGSKPTRTLQGMARVRSGQAPAWPLVSDRSVRRGSRVKRDFACTFTRHFPPVLVVLRSQSCLRLEGRARTLSGPSPDLSPARTLAPSGVRGVVDQVVTVKSGCGLSLTQ